MNKQEVAELVDKAGKLLYTYTFGGEYRYMNKEYSVICFLKNTEDWTTGTTLKQLFEQEYKYIYVYKKLNDGKGKVEMIFNEGEL